MHQLGLFPAAMHYYKKALAAKPIIEDDGLFDLSQEAAFNLSLIYQASGSNDIARLYQQKYIVIWTSKKRRILNDEKTLSPECLKIHYHQNVKKITVIWTSKINRYLNVEKFIVVWTLNSWCAKSIKELSINQAIENRK